MALLSAVLTHAVEEGHRADNPARGIVLPAYKRRRVHLDAERYTALGRATSAAEARGEAWQAVGAIRLLALTGCRMGEIVGLKRAECDIHGACLRFSDTKTGESVRPLGQPAFELVKSVLQRSRGPYVFPALRLADAPYGGLAKAWLRIRDWPRPSGPKARAPAAKPLLAGLTLHGLRHAFASVADDLGYTEATIGAMLGHSGGGTTRGYIHKLDPALLAAADRVSQRILEMMAGCCSASDLRDTSATMEASERAMTSKQFDKYAERLADRHGLSLQLTSAWLRNGGYDKLSPRYGLSPYELGVLRAFAKVES